MALNKIKGKIIAITNQKGGVGKTTTAINLATSMAAIQKNVLLIDFDPQGNASTGLGINREDRELGAYQILGEEDNIEGSIKKTIIPGLEIIPATVDLSAVEVELVDADDRMNRLQRHCEALKKKIRFYIYRLPAIVRVIDNKCINCSRLIINPITV